MNPAVLVTDDLHQSAVRPAPDCAPAAPPRFRGGHPTPGSQALCRYGRTSLPRRHRVRPSAERDRASSRLSTRVMWSGRLRSADRGTRASKAPMCMVWSRTDELSLHRPVRTTDTGATSVARGLLVSSEVARSRCAWTSCSVASGSCTLSRNRSMRQCGLKPGCPVQTTSSAGDSGAVIGPVPLRIRRRSDSSGSVRRRASTASRTQENWAELDIGVSIRAVPVVPCRRQRRESTAESGGSAEGGEELVANAVRPNMLIRTTVRCVKLLDGLRRTATGAERTVAGVDQLRRPGPVQCARVGL